MNKSLKKIISVVLSLVMIMSFAVVSLATDGEVPAEEHGSMFDVFIGYILAFWEAIRYVFYDVFLGVAP